MKFKDLLQTWEDTAYDYYSKFSDKEIENLYAEWFGNSIDHYPEMERGQMTDELIEDEYSYRKQDNAYELKNAIINYKNYHYA
jgi:hypothetical protein